MSWTTAIRQKARQKRQELGLPPEQLATADVILVELQAATGIACCLLPAGDALLAGAQAVLNMPMETIFQDGSRPEPARRFDAAHEYAHVFLHSDSYHCKEEDLGTDSLTPPADVGANRVDGYSPRQRRESEANAYAAELLLPDALLRRLFFDEKQSADQIADAVGLAPSLVLAQMTEVLLLPPLSSSIKDIPPPSAQAVILDPFQRAAAEISTGPLLLGAGPGTGKTKTLVGRCQYLTGQGMPAEKILCLTFSRDAAQEMQERLTQAGVGSGGSGPWVGTFHSLGLDLLKRYGERIGLRPEVQLIGTLDAITLLENNLSRLGLEVLDNLYNPTMHLRGILRQISRAKDELCTPERYAQLCVVMQEKADLAAAEFAARSGKKLKKDQEVIDKALVRAAKAAEIARCYGVYEELMAEHGYLDFGDLIYRSVQLLETCPDVRAAVQAEFTHVLADEYQDINRACARLIRLLVSEDATGLWAVGDHRQSIYRFRGASPANVAAFQVDYPTGKRLELGVNYRSLQPVVDCFGAVARTLTPPSEQPTFEVWQANRGHENPDGLCTEGAAMPAVLLALASDEEGQANGIAGLIEQMKPVHSYSQQAILCRTRAQAQALVDLLNVRDIPVLYLGNLMDRPEVKDLLCLLSLFAKETGSGLLRVGALPEYSVPQEDILTFLGYTRQSEITIFEALQDPEMRQGLSEAAQAGLQSLGRHLAELDLLEDDPAALLRHYLFNLSHFLRHLAADGTKPFLRLQKMLAIYQFYALMLAFDRRVVAPTTAGGPPNRIQEFLTHLRRQAAAGESPQGTVPAGAEDLDAVQILTAHKAKGLEYPVVFIPNLGRGQFPAKGRSDGLPEPPGLTVTLKNSLSDGKADLLSSGGNGSEESEVDESEADEDQCLFFVALSRARDRLIMSRSAASRTDRETPPSPLLSLLEGWLEAQPASQADWPSGRAEAAEELEMEGETSDRPTFSASALETYERCPRQYWYERELKLPSTFQGTGYALFHGCVRQVLNWMEDQQAAGLNNEQAAGLNPSTERLLEKLEEVWAVSGPLGHLHEIKYKDSAIQMLEAARNLLEGRDAQKRPHLIATLSNCRVTVRPDSLQRRKEDGVLVLARRLTGKPGADDQRSGKLALLRAAAAETLLSDECALELHYLADGQIVEVPLPATPYKAQLEADRLKKYERAARGIRLRLFPTEPSAADECQTCAYALVCPQ